MTAAEEALLTKALALLSPPLIFRKIPKCFNTSVWHFLNSSLNRRSHIYADLLNSICYFARQRPILGHCQEDSLSHLMLIIAFLSFFNSKVTGNLLKMSFQKLEMDCKQTHRHTDWLTHRQTDEQRKVKVNLLMNLKNK